jgi:CBS domain containing-hemolysin-like protein
LNDGDSVNAIIVYMAGAFILSAFFSVIKIVFASAEKSGVGIGADDDRLRYCASRISELLKNRSALSDTVTVGKTLCNVSFAALAFKLHLILAVGFYGAGSNTSTVYGRYSGLHAISLSDAYARAVPALALCVVPIAFSFVALVLFAHYVPRALALRFYRGMLRPAYYVYSLLSWLLLPCTWLFSAAHSAILRVLKYNVKLSFLSEEEKARIIADDDAAEALGEEEREMIRNVFDLSDTTVDEIMVPRINVIAAEVRSDLQAVLRMIREEGHSRIPIYKDTIDQITGILYAKDIFPWVSEHNTAEWNLAAIAKKCHYVPMGKKVKELMKEFKVKHLHMAVIVDEYGGTAGIVTMEDILEEIVGDIQDEYDEEEKEVVPVDDNVYFVDPHIDLRDLNDELGTDLDEEADYNTLSGLIYHECGDVPAEGAQIECAGVRITVVKMDNQRIEKVKLEVLQAVEKAEAEPF